MRVRPIRIEGDVAFITLSKGLEAVIDAADAPLVAGKNWHASQKRLPYAARWERTDGKLQLIFMHRLLIECPEGLTVDHIDGDGLNNRRSNLRVATVTENNRNRPKPRNNTSGFKGVVYRKRDNKWYAQIKANKKYIWLGQFSTPEEAHQAYAAASVKYHGEFARTA